MRHQSVATAAIALALAMGCDRDEAIRTYSVPKTPPGLPTVLASAKAPGAESIKAAPKPANTGGVQWSVPKDWKEVPVTDSMRHAAFSVSDEHPEALVTVVPLSPSDTLANVNRWEGQLKLPPSPAEKLPQIVTSSTIDGVPAESVDLIAPEGEGRQRLLVTTIKRADRYWFIKLIGPADVVGAQKANFDAFVKSVHFADAPDPALATEVELKKWNAPAGWTPDTQQDPNAMVKRILAFNIAGEAGEAAQVAITKLPADRTGSTMDNVNRWRGQVGLPPAQTPDGENVEKIAANGSTWPMFDFVGPATGAAPAKRMLVALGVKRNEIWFVKLTGTQPLVEKQKPAFVEFLKSLQFSGEIPQ